MVAYKISAVWKLLRFSLWTKIQSVFLLSLIIIFYNKKIKFSLSVESSLLTFKSSMSLYTYILDIIYSFFLELSLKSSTKISILHFIFPRLVTVCVLCILMIYKQSCPFFFMFIYFLLRYH